MSGSRSIDLHGHTVPEAMRAFVRFYNNAVRGGYQGRIEIVHGYGSTGGGGVIRQHLRTYLAANAGKFGSVLHGESLGNPGVTVVYAKSALPDNRGAILHVTPAQEAILRFCQTPKPKDRILMKLRGRFGDRVLDAEIRALQQSGGLEELRAADGAVQYRAPSAK
jgi:hypothetical protein